MSKPEEKMYFIVHNPVAGTSDPVEVVSELDRQFLKAERRYERYVTRGDEDIGMIVRDAVARGMGAVIAAGGDGTVSAVANGLAGTMIPLGVLPLGSGNSFAREMDIPLNLGEALELLTGEHQVRKIDVLQVGERRFVLSLSAGVTSRVISETSRDEKRNLGKLAYFPHGVTQMLDARRYRFTLHLDGQVIKTRASEIFVANAGLAGFRSLRLDPEIRIDDGEMNLCIIRAEEPAEYFNLLLNLINPIASSENGGLFCLPAVEEIRIEADEPLAVQGDGDIIGETPIVINLVPGALRVITP